MAKRGYIVAGLMTALLTIGCSLPGQAPTGPGRVVVHYGSMELAPNADLALVLDVRNLLGAGYKVQQAAGSSVKTISAKVTGQNLVEPVVASVDLSQCVDGLATLNFTNLPPGPVEVVVNAVDAEGNPLAWATGRAVIRPNETAKVTLKCSSTGGNLAIDFDCPELCGDTSPSPSPVPTPTPTPLNPTKLNMLGSLTGLFVDETNTLHLMGYDIQPSGGGIGRALKVPFDLKTPTVLTDDIGPAGSAAVVDNQFTIHDGPFLKTLNLSSGALVNSVNVGSYPNSAPVTRSTSGDVLYGYYAAGCGAAGCSATVAVRAAGSSTPLLNYGGADAIPFGMINYLSFDGKTQKPIWAGPNGIGTVGASASTVPTMSLSVVGGVRGVKTVSDESPLYLYSTGRKVMLWDSSNATNAPKPVLDFGTLNPVQIERGPDNGIYVVVTNSAANYNISNTYKIIKYRFDGANLVEPYEMINTF